MSQLVVREVHTRREKKRFLEYPWTLYRDDPYWIPPLRDNQKRLVGYAHHPFYERNLVTTFLAYRDNEVCGRIAAILNRGHNLRTSERRGFFGFFESVDDQEVANGLFDAARQWFAKQGIHCLRGPVNPSLNYEVGLLVDSFDSSPTFMMTYNPEYYPKLLENYGFKKTQDLYAYHGTIDMLPKIRDRFLPIVEQMIEHFDVTVRPLDKSKYTEDVEMFLSIYNRSLANTWGFVPMPQSELKHLAHGLQYLIVPELALAAEIDGKMIGAVFALPDYNPRVKKIDGRLFPFGAIKLLRKKQNIKKIRLISTNVVPEYQRMGLGLVLLDGLVPKAIDWGIEEAEFSWVLESNSLSRGSLEKGGAKLDKTYRVYDLDEPLDVKKTFQIATIDADGDGGPIDVGQVASRRDQTDFIKLPWRIYAGDPNWVPPLLVEVKKFVNPKKHPFFQHGEAVRFLAKRNGETIGRILVSDDLVCNEQRGENVGCFGMFESVEDPKVAHALLDHAAEWLRLRGRDTIRGPIDYSTNYPCGMLIDGFDTPPRVMMNHNPMYYPELLESWGAKKATDMFAWWFADKNDMVKKWQQRAEKIAKRGRIKIRPFRKNDFVAELKRCRQVYNESGYDSWGFARLTDVEFRYLGKQLVETCDPNMILLAEVDEKPVGFSVTLPDMNEAIRPLNGRLTKFGMPIGLAKLMINSRRIKTARMAVLDVLKGYRRRGIAEMLILETLNYGSTMLGYTAAELSWTLEDNKLVQSAIKTVGAERYKTYRIYEKPIRN